MSAPSPSSAAPPRADQARTRHAQLLATAHVFARAGGAGRGSALGSLECLEHAEAALSDLSLQPPDRRDSSPLLASVEEGLRLAERRLAQAEAQASWLELRRALEDPGVALEDVIGFGRRLLRRLPREPAAAPAFEAVVLRVASGQRADGARFARPRFVVMGRLRALAEGARPVDPAVVERARTELAAFRRRVVERSGGRALFEGGLYLEALGLKLRWPAALADPEVMYAAAQLSLEVEKRALRAVADEPELAPLYQAAREQVESVYLALRSEEAPSGDPPEAPVETAARPTPARAPSRSGRRRMLVVAALVCGTGGASVALRLDVEPARVLREVALADGAWPSCLSAVALTGPGGLAVAQAEPVRWRELTPEAKALALDQLQRALAARQLEHALVFVAGSLVARIDRGEVWLSR